MSGFKMVDPANLEDALTELHRNIQKSDKIMQEVVPDYFYILRNPEKAPDNNLKMSYMKKGIWDYN